MGWLHEQRFVQRVQDWTEFIIRRSGQGEYTEKEKSGEEEEGDELCLVWEQGKLNKECHKRQIYEPQNNHLKWSTRDEEIYKSLHYFLWVNWSWDKCNCYSSTTLSAFGKTARQTHLTKFTTLSLQRQQKKITPLLFWSLT